ncbi:UDP-glucuronosyl/UDP-glucosyltransferase family-containing protein [Strongyloides ratti]|uniref:glucuronosyltransferase n=1 Tax=Strongyloides ratti TaxID=34506 RepID=A0A090KXH1_STRRB|nr:UDP-glucuronosyl/UDP-glucosyltransferase family-containing protein [Strongyloides ratti]CEF59963.1 UDP-glucuronosyl/UDP-glucosyltransferase family-containing protein [Strongyloides ratti]
MKLKIIFFILLICIYKISSINVLFFLIGTNQFERHIFEYLAQQLALRHHSVVTIKPILIPEEPRLVKPKLHMVKEKLLKNMLSKEKYEPLIKVGSIVPWKKVYEYEEMDEPYWIAHNASCDKMLNSNLMDVIKKEEIDVAIVYSKNPCQLGLLHVLGLPYIYFDLDGLTDETIIASSIPWNLNIELSHCPISHIIKSPLLRKFTNGLCLTRQFLIQSGIERLSRFLSKQYDKLDGEISRLFASDYEIKKRFSTFPDVNILKRNAELYFINTDILLENNLALPLNVIPVGGLHIDHVKPLFYPWNTTISSAKDGVIVVSFGSQAIIKGIKSELFKPLYNVLSKLTTYRIYWRLGPEYEELGIEMDKVPSHINITTFIPQNDLLAQKKTKLFITNGGISSIMESIFHGVPMIGIPLYGVNRQNLYKMKNKGLGLVIEKADVTEKYLMKCIKNVLENNKYSLTVKDMSKAIKSRSESSFQRALYYIEYVGKYNGGKFLKNKNKLENFISQIHPFVFVVIIFIIIIFIKLTLAFMWYIKIKLKKQETGMITKIFDKKKKE